MKTFDMTLKIRAECEDDARELIDDYSGMQTDIEIIKVTLEETKFCLLCEDKLEGDDDDKTFSKRFCSAKCMEHFNRM
jgi:hypothetical protein